MKRDITTDAGKLLLDMYFARNTNDEEDARQLIITIEEQAREQARRASPFTYNINPFNTTGTATTVTYRFDTTSGSNAITTLTNESPPRNL